MGDGVNRSPSHPQQSPSVPPSRPAGQGLPACWPGYLQALILQQLQNPSVPKRGRFRVGVQQEVRNGFPASTHLTGYW